MISRGAFIRWRGRLARIDGKITGAIANVKIAVAGVGDFHLDFAEGGVGGRLFGREAQGVLITEIASDERGNAGDGFGGLREVGNAASAFAEAAKDAWIFFLTFALENDGIDDHLRALRESEDLRKLLMAGVVTAVANDDEGLFLTMAETQMIEGFGDRVIEGGSSASGNGLQSRLQIFCVMGERLSTEDLQPDVIVEIDDEHFVLRITGMREGGDGGGDFGELGAHAAAVVDDEADGNGRIFLLKESELLRATVFKDAERFLG